MLNFINQRKKFETFTRELLLVLSNSGCDQPFVTLRKTDNWRYVPTPIGHSSGGNSVKKRKNWVRVPLQSLVFCKLTDGWSHSFRQYADSVWQCIKSSDDDCTKKLFTCWKRTLLLLHYKGSIISSFWCCLWFKSYIVNYKLREVAHKDLGPMF